MMSALTELTRRDSVGQGFWVMAGTSHFEVEDLRSESRFVLVDDVDGRELGELVYSLENNRLVLLHTGVREDVRRNGIGGRLVSAAVKRAGYEGLTIVPRCSFARSWLKAHPDALGTTSLSW